MGHQEPPKRRHEYTATYRQLHDRPPPATVTWGESQADIISPGRGFIAAFDLTMQLQVGCPGGCLFCYVPAGRRLTPAGIKGPQGRDWGFRVRNKRNVLRKFRRHLATGTLADKTIYWSGVTDPYAAPPAVTRNLWQALLAAPLPLRPRRIVVQSRFRPDRDAAVMAQYNRETQPGDGGPAVLVSYSIGTDRDDLIRAWERATPRFAQRMQAIEKLRQGEITVVATLSPLGPWQALTGTLEQFKAWGVAYLTCLFFKEDTGSANTPHAFTAYLRRYHPHLLQRRWQQEQVRKMRAVYGRRRVLLGQAGFASLAAPQRVVARPQKDYVSSGSSSSIG